MPHDIYDRVFAFACRIVRLHRSLTPRGTHRAIGTQLLRCWTAIGANLQEAEAGQSRADFISKTRIALKEAREAHYWLRLIAATDIIEQRRVQPLIDEANEIVAILTSIVKSASARSK